MGDVYAAAERVVVWLGQEIEEVRDVFSDIQRLIEMFRITEIAIPSSSYLGIIAATEDF